MIILFQSIMGYINTIDRATNIAVLKSALLTVMRTVLKGITSKNTAIFLYFNYLMAVIK